MLRDELIEAGARAEWPWEADAVLNANWRAAGVRKVKEQIVSSTLDAILDHLEAHAIPMVAQGGLSGAFYRDDDPDDDSVWLIDINALRPPVSSSQENP